jgi:hypothetical protein
LKYFLLSNNISNLFKNGSIQNANNQTQINAINDKDMLDIAELKINYLEKEIKIVQFLIKSKKKTDKNYSINNYKIIKAKDIIQQIGVIEETLNEGFASNYNSTKDVLGFISPCEFKTVSKANCPAAAKFPNDQGFISKESQRSELGIIFIFC